MYVLISSIIISIITFWIWLLLFKKLKILDTPWKYKDLKRKTPVPKLMGIFLIISVIISILLLIPNYLQYKEVQYLLFWAIFLWIITIIDDIKWISAKYRFLIQILVSIIWILWWAIISNFWFLWDIYHIPYWLWFIISLVWFILIINAFNWFDGINWMGSWVATIWFVSMILLIKLVILNYYQVTPEEYKHLVVLLNLCIIMSWVSFVSTIIEFKPFWLLRDVWVMFLWYVLAYLSLLSWWKVGILIVVLSLVLFDSFWVIINRIKNKKNPMQWDYTHFHHRLMKHWWTREEIRMFVRIWSLFFMIIMILQWINTTNKIIILFMVFWLFFWIHIYLYWIKKLPQWMWDRDKDL